MGVFGGWRPPSLVLSLEPARRQEQGRGEGGGELRILANITPVLTKSKVKGDVESTVNAVSAALTTEDLTKYLTEVAVDKKSYASVAKEFIDANDLG